MSEIPYKKTNGKIHFMFIGAHPDDADIKAGGTAIKFLEARHKVTFVSLTNGDAGHQSMSREDLAKRRKLESQAVEKYLGIEYIVWTNHDGELQVTLENREKLITLIREKKPTIIVTHRPNDYHADHRNTSLLVQDASYLLAVPNVCPTTPSIEYNPIILYSADNFSKPYPFIPNIFIDITNVYDKKMRALSLHESQVFEWLPFVEKRDQDIPKSKQDRLEWLKKSRHSNTGNVNKNLPILKKLLTPDKFNKIKYIEAFEACEYGDKLTKDNIQDIIPFGIPNL